MPTTTDFLVIGSGIAGLTFAIRYFLMTLHNQGGLLFSGQAPKVTKEVFPPSFAVGKAFAPAFTEPEPAIGQ